LCGPKPQVTTHALQAAWAAVGITPGHGPCPMSAGGPNGQPRRMQDWGSELWLHICVPKGALTK